MVVWTLKPNGYLKPDEPLLQRLDCNPPQPASSLPELLNGIFLRRASRPSGCADGSLERDAVNVAHHDWAKPQLSASSRRAQQQAPMVGVIALDLR